MKVYTAGAMTGLSGEELVERSTKIAQVLSDYKIEVLDPVTSEGIKEDTAIIQTTYEDLSIFWKRDKELIRACHVVFDITPERKSEGVAHEIGYARYHLWKPVVRVYLSGGMPTKGSVAYFEDDLLVESLDEACIRSLEMWGTHWKRVKWRLRIYSRCWFKALQYRIEEWFK